MAPAWQAGCDKKAQPGARAALVAALGGLAEGNAATFLSNVVPAQRAKVRSLKEWAFFKAVKRHKISDEFAKAVDDTTASIMATLYFDAAQKVHTIITFTMKKVSGKWGVDLTESIRMAKAVNGAFAFTKYKIVVKKR